MLIGSFKTYTPASILKVPLFGLFLWAFYPFYHHTPLPGGTGIQMPLYTWIALFSGRYFFLSAFFSLLLNVLSAFWLNYIINQHSLLSKKTYLPALFYLIYNAFCGELLTLHPGNLANILLIGACSELFNTYRKDSALTEVFNAGLLLGLASLVYLPSLILFFFIWVTLVIYRPFIWRDYVVSLLGLLLPWIYFGVYLFWKNELKTTIPALFKEHLIHKHLTFQVGTAYLWLYIVLGTVILASLSRLVSSHVVLPLKSKKTFSLLFWCFLLTLISIYLNPSIGPASLAMTSIPLAIFTSNFFLQIRKAWTGELLFSFILLTIFLAHLSTYMHR